MKKIIIICVLALCYAGAWSQSDTLFTRKGKKIPCTIREISETEIKYKRAGIDDGPLFTIDKSSVLKYSLANGFTETITPDEMSIEHEHREILGNRQAIKFQP